MPWVSAWTSLVLALSCVGTLIYFINHVAVLLQVNTVLAEIVADFERVVLEQGASGDALSTAVRARAGGPDFSLLAVSSGYLQWIDYPQLVDAAKKSGCEMAFLYHPGRFVLKGSPLAVGWADVGQEKGAPLPALIEAFEKHVRLGPRRTMRQDPEFAIAQIVEIGLRAMSPAVNDPFTMLTCVDALAVCLRLSLASPEHRPLHLDGQGTVRVSEKPLTFKRLAAAGFDPMRQVSRDSTAATIRIFQAIAALAPSSFDASQLDELETQVDLAREGYASSAASRDRQDVERELNLVKEALGDARRRLAAPH